MLESPLDISFKFTPSDLVAFLCAVVIVAFYFQDWHWTLNNVLGVSFCLQGIEKFSLGTYKIGAILLVGLFFYDIFWVFGTDVMVTVAKKLDGPIKLLFPRTLIPNAETGKIELSLLGLGDIVIPGFFLALLLRFYASLANVSTTAIDIHASFPKPYFHSALFAYVLGLGTTLFVMIQFNAAQPALLYLVPACLGSSFLCAVVRGELKELMAYSEEEEEAEESKEEEKPEEAKKDN
jgi:minor histocompatibility antigen H13